MDTVCCHCCKEISCKENMAEVFSAIIPLGLFLFVLLFNFCSKIKKE